MKNREIQVITCMIMLTRSSERIFNQMRYAGNLLLIYFNDTGQWTCLLIITEIE